MLCAFCRMEIPEGYFDLGAVADHEVWKVKGGEYACQYIELAHNTCARGDDGEPKPGWELGDAAQTD